MPRTRGMPVRSVGSRPPPGLALTLFGRPLRSEPSLQAVAPPLRVNPGAPDPQKLLVWLDRAPTSKNDGGEGASRDGRACGANPGADCCLGPRAPRPRLREEVMLAVAQANACDLCTLAHRRWALAEGVTDEELAAIEGHDPKQFDRRTWAAIAWAQARTRADLDPVPDELEAELARHYDERERADLELVTQAMGVANRSANTLTRCVSGCAVDRCGQQRRRRACTRERRRALDPSGGGVPHAPSRPPPTRLAPASRTIRRAHSLPFSSSATCRRVTLPSRESRGQVRRAEIAALDEKQLSALHGKQYSAERYCGGDVADHRAICEPTIAVFSLGSWKASIGLVAFRAIPTNSFLRQARIGGASVSLIAIRETK